MLRKEVDHRSISQDFFQELVIPSVTYSSCFPNFNEGHIVGSCFTTRNLASKIVETSFPALNFLLVEIPTEENLSFTPKALTLTTLKKLPNVPNMVTISLVRLPAISGICIALLT